jgi:serine/threonine-protein kinase
VPPSAKHADLGVEVGQVFLGKYRVDAILGQGGMGVVAQCHHLQLDERVAIKMLRPDVLGDQDSVQRFVREAQAAARIKSEYVARVVDVGSFETGVPYMVMEFLDGYDLGQAVEGGKQLSVPLTVELSLQACEALAEAHSLGIVHRDVKPTNLFVVWRADKPKVKVLDFGISKTSTATDLKLTQTQSLLGTPAYMSPEQMRSAREVDARTDIWSLGTVMYEAIEGRRPFEAESFSEMVVKVSMEPPTPMRNAPINLQGVILKCLCKQPDQRYQSMADLGRDLIPFAQDQHAAQVLVDRMYRMLRGSQLAGAGDWDRSSTGAGQRLPSDPAAPLPLGHPASGPVAMAAQSAPNTQMGLGMPGPQMQAGQMAMAAIPQPMSHGGSQPVMGPPAGPATAPPPGVWAGGSNISAEPWQNLQGTDPTAARLSSAHDAHAYGYPRPQTPAANPTAIVRPPTRGVPLAAKLGILVFAGVIGALVAVLSTSKPQDTDAPPAPPQHVQMAVTPPVIPAVTHPVTQPPVPPTPVTPTPVSPVAVPDDGAAGSGVAPDAIVVDPEPTGKPRNTGRPTATGHPAGGRPHNPPQQVKSNPPLPNNPTTAATTQVGSAGTAAATPTGTGSAAPLPEFDASGHRIVRCWNGKPVDQYAHGCPKP